MQVFVTGGTGFVGANVVRHLLQEGHDVRALVRPTSCVDNLAGLDVEYAQGDLNDPELWRAMQGCQALFHVAAHYSLWRVDREQLYRSNVLGTRNCLAAAQRAGIERTVYTSSVAAIGTGFDGQSVNESHQSPVEKLIGHYKKSKFWAEQEALKAAQAGQDVVIVNPTSPIGAWDIKPTPTGDIILRFLRRQMPFYMDTGLNFVDVQDVAQGHLQAWYRAQSGQRYILGHQNMTLKALLDQLEGLTGLPAPRQEIPACIPLAVAWMDETVLARLGKSPSVPVDGVRMAQKKMYFDAAKAVEDLGLPQTPITVALERAIAWFQSHGYVQ
ncbi:MAG: hopanoid-associated sugar epimerase [Leptolyngbyaceae cyanobacterium]